jgi:hypothetical protein
VPGFIRPPFQMRVKVLCTMRECAALYKNLLAEEPRQGGGFLRVAGREAQGRIRSVGRVDRQFGDLDQPVSLIQFKAHVFADAEACRRRRLMTGRTCDSPDGIRMVRVRVS